MAASASVISELESLFHWKKGRERHWRCIRSALDELSARVWFTSWLRDKRWQTDGSSCYLPSISWSTLSSLKPCRFDPWTSPKCTISEVVSELDFGLRTSIEPPLMFVTFKPPTGSDACIQIYFTRRVTFPKIFKNNITMTSPQNKNKISEAKAREAREARAAPALQHASLQSLHVTQNDTLWGGKVKAASQ